MGSDSAFGEPFYAGEEIEEFNPGDPWVKVEWTKCEDQQPHEHAQYLVVCRVMTKFGAYYAMYSALWVEREKRWSEVYTGEDIGTATPVYWAPFPNMPDYIWEGLGGQPR